VALNGEMADLTAAQMRALAQEKRRLRERESLGGAAAVPKRSRVRYRSVGEIAGGL